MSVAPTKAQQQRTFDGANEAAMLITCLRGLPFAVPPDTNWQALAQMAEENGVLPLFYQSLVDTGAQMPESFIAAALQSRKATEKLASELEHLLHRFGEQGLDVLPLKGPALSLELYGDPALRTCKDLDLLVRIDDFSRAEALLVEQGFTAGAINDSERRFLRDGISVELHFDITSPQIYRFDLEGIWSRSRRVYFRGAPMHTMSHDDLVLFLCSHGLSHGFTRLIWILDVARALEGLDPDSCRQLMQHAERSGLLPWLLIGCEVVRAMFPEKVSEAMYAAIAGFPQEAERARLAAARLFAEGVGGVANTYQASYLESGSGRGQWRHRFGYFVPTAEDYRWAEHHRIHRTLMPVLRPIRLLQKYGPLRVWRIIFPSRV